MIIFYGASSTSMGEEEEASKAFLCAMHGYGATYL